MLVLKPASRPFSQCNKYYCINFALVLVSLVKTRLTQNRSDTTNEQIIIEHHFPSDGRSA